MLKRTVALFSVVIALAMSQNMIVNNGQVRAIPKTMNYQGYLTDATGNPITNPSISMTFAIFDAASSGNQKWTESQTVAVDRGIFNVMLGSIAPIPDSVFTKGIDRWLQLTVSAQVLSPRTKIIATSYAYTATYSDTAEYARNAVNDNDWIRIGSDSVLYTARRLGVARGNAGNMLLGDSAFTHTNLGGYACTTGISGINMTYATICGGYRNRADSLRSTVAGGYRNYALGGYSFIGGGSQNTAGGTATFIGAGAINTTANGYSAIGGGYANTVSGAYGVVAGGRSNSVAGSYSAIAGGYADTITAAGIYSYLFGIGSKLTQDSTFMVDMPHVWFGTEVAGYELPRSRGANGQVMVTNGTGQLSWGDPPAASKWTVADSVLYTNLRWGLARGGAGNILYGTNIFTHTNFGGWACTTGTSGSNFTYITIGGGYGNRVDSSYAVVAGGNANKCTGQYAFIGGGSSNTANSRFSTIGGGNGNNTNGAGATIAGGYSNDVSALYSFIGGGYGNSVSGTYSIVDGGYLNYNAGAFSAILGGRADTITAAGDYSYLFGINSNLTQDSTFMVDMPHIRFGTEAAGYELPRNDGTSGQVMVTDGNGQLSWMNGTSFDDWTANDSALYTNQWIGLMRGGADNAMLGSYAYTHTNWGGCACTTGISAANHQYITISGGLMNRALYSGAVVAGGRYNTTGYYAFIGGGESNYAPEAYNVVCGGYLDSALAIYAGILSGYHNIAGDGVSDTAAVVAGGSNNRVRDKYAFIGGGRENFAYGPYSTVTGGYGDTALAYFGGVLSGIRNSAGVVPSDTAAVVAGGRYNSAGSKYAFVGGGYSNSTNSAHSVVVGGYDNSTNGLYAFVGSGRRNDADGSFSAVAGGYYNDANGSNSFIGAGQSNTTDSSYAVVLNGDNNRAADNFSFIANGYNNYTAGYHTAILGGRLDTLTSLAFFSMAFGEQVYVNSDHRVVFFDGWNPGRFALNRDSHDGISYPIHVGTTTANGNGAYLTNGGIWSDGSSRYKKEDFQALDGAVLLQKVAGLDITKWKFINSGERHISPVAQDFYQAFGCGTGNIEDDSTHIAAMDLAGVSLAAIKELNKLVREQREVIDIQQEKIAGLESRLKALENR